MPITPTNQSKNTITPTGQVKTFSIQGVYGVGLYGYAVYGVGVAGYGSVINESKSPSSSITIEAGQPMGLLLAITYPSQIVVGSGVVNQSKS